MWTANMYNQCMYMCINTNGYVNWLYANNMHILQIIYAYTYPCEHANMHNKCLYVCEHKCVCIFYNKFMHI